MIRLARPDIDAADLAAVAEVLRSGYLVQGPKVAEFEHQVAQRAGVPHGVALANCTAALHLALLSLDIGPGDAVAVTAYSWPATANAVVLCGAEVAFVDIDPVTWNMAPAGLEAVLGTRKNVRAILPVHVFGGMADMLEIMRIADAHGLSVVEDAACALGAVLDGRPAGGFGRIGCFSFHPRKSITTGEGGVLVTSDAAIARRSRALRNHGINPDGAGPDFILPGYNLRLTEMQGALGLTQLAKLDRLLAHRRTLVSHYAEALSGLDLTLPVGLSAEAHVYQAYVVLLPVAGAARRASIIGALKAAGVEATIGTHHQPLIRHFRERDGYTVGDFPVTDTVAARALALPLHSGMNVDDVNAVTERLSVALRGVA
ncbi:MAG: DegT/DnrJ/EryC1/StrS family aminotransferase [Gemmatimonadales bacterium]